MKTRRKLGANGVGFLNSCVFSAWGFDRLCDRDQNVKDIKCTSETGNSIGRVENVKEKCFIYRCYNRPEKRNN